MKEAYLDEPRQSPSTPAPSSGVRHAVRGIATSRALPGEGPLIGPNGASFEVRVADALWGDIEIGAVVAEVPAFYTVKGMFFAALLSQLGERSAGVAQRLTSAPRTGIYLPFSDYPARDFFWLVDLAARAAHPNRGGREAYRRLARQQVAVFAQSGVGKVAMSLATDPGAALQRYAESPGALMKGPTIQVWQDGPNAALVVLSQYRGVIEYPLGIFEGLVARFGVTPTTAVDVLARDAVQFSMRW